MCQDIREGMGRRGIVPAASRVLLNAEAKAAGFIDTPELQASDLAFLSARAEKNPLCEDDRWPRLKAELDRIGQHYLDGSLPDFRFASMMHLRGWALAQYRLLPAIPNGGYGVSESTS